MLSLSTSSCPQPLQKPPKPEKGKSFFVPHSGQAPSLALKGKVNKDIIAIKEKMMPVKGMANDKIRLKSQAGKITITICMGAFFTLAVCSVLRAWLVILRIMSKQKHRGKHNAIPRCYQTFYCLKKRVYSFQSKALPIGRGNNGKVTTGGSPVNVSKNATMSDTSFFERLVSSCTSPMIFTASANVLAEASWK